MTYLTILFKKKNQIKELWFFLVLDSTSNNTVFTKKLNGTKWSAFSHCWRIHFRKENTPLSTKTFKRFTTINLEKLPKKFYSIEPEDWQKIPFLIIFIFF